MSAQAELFDSFDLALGDALRRTGIEQAATSRETLLALGREYARRAALSRPDRTATADDAARGLEAAGLGSNALGNGAGALFRGGDWIFTGRWKKSARVTNHAHQNRVWQLVA